MVVNETPDQGSEHAHNEGDRNLYDLLIAFSVVEWL